MDNATRAWIACASGPERAARPIVLLSKPGGNGVVASAALRQAPADGATMLMAGMSQTTVTPFIYKKQPFDPEKEFHPVAMFGTAPFLLVASAQSGIKSLKDLQAHARANPNGIDFGVTAIASPPHLLSAAMSAKLGIQSTAIPVGGESQGVTGLLGGQFPVMIFVAGSAMTQIAAGKLIPLMTFTDQRLPLLPNVPTVIEEMQDPSLIRAGWMGISVRAGTPVEAINAIESWTRSCLATPEFKSALSNALFTPTFKSQIEFAARIREDIEFWRPWITRLNISND